MSHRDSVTWLFVPGDRPERFAKAAGASADEVIIDLEDAVAIDQKAAARSSVVEYLSRGGSTWVRINPPGTAFHDDDVHALTGLPGLRGVVLPKAEDPEAIATLPRRFGARSPVVALIESALGIAWAGEIAARRVVERLAFGSIDFALDIDADETDASLLFARGSLVVASRAAGIAAPIDGVTMSVGPPAAASEDARRARSLGFGGKLCIHPTQVSPVRRAFRPTDSEADWARQVLAVAGRGDGAFTDAEGRMVDAPVVQRAKRILDRVEGTGYAAA